MSAGKRFWSSCAFQNPLSIRLTPGPCFLSVPDQHLIIFAKAPRPGQVKTRFAKALGPGAACLAYRDLVEALIENLSSLPAVELRFTPDDALPEIQSWLRKGWSAHRQGEGD